MTQPLAPAMLQLAPLPRQQSGPFLLLGVDKDADADAIDAAWAQRLIWARKGLTSTPLEDVNWARDVLKDAARRLRADAASLNVDTSDGLMRRLRRRFEGKTPGEGSILPLDVEKSLAQYRPDIPLPEDSEILAGLAPPQPPGEVPMAAALLDDLAARPLDPWEDFPGERNASINAGT